MVRGTYWEKKGKFLEYWVRFLLLHLNAVGIQSLLPKDAKNSCPQLNNWRWVISMDGPFRQLQKGTATNWAYLPPNINYWFLVPIYIPKLVEPSTDALMEFQCEWKCKLVLIIPFIGTGKSLLCSKAGYFKCWGKIFIGGSLALANYAQLIHSWFTRKVAQPFHRLIWRLCQIGPARGQASCAPNFHWTIKVDQFWLQGTTGKLIKNSAEARKRDA